MKTPSHIYKLRFSTKELIGLTIIFTCLGLAVFVNMRISLRKSRDAQRRGDMRTMQSALTAFQDRYGYYPDSKDGGVIGCESGALDENGKPIFRVCEWGWDKLAGVSLPTDPNTSDGLRYRYESVREYFQVFASLEGHDDEEYNPKVEKRGLWCGTKVCNFGLSNDETPVDSDLAEYKRVQDVKKAK